MGHLSFQQERILLFPSGKLHGHSKAPVAADPVSYTHLRSNPDSIVLHDKNNLILPFMSRNAENRLFRTKLDRIDNQLGQNKACLLYTSLLSLA